MKKFLSFIMVIVLIFATALPCVYAADEVTVSQVEEMLKGIDTLQQIQSKRSSYTASSHYDINTTNTSIITKQMATRPLWAKRYLDTLLMTAILALPLILGGAP